LPSTADGRIVAAHGVKTIPPGSSLADLPAVERALAGFVRDDVWIFQGMPYRIAARPVLDAGGYAGAIVHAMRIDDRFAELLSKRTDGATVAFFVGDKAVAQHTPAIGGAVRGAELSSALGTARTSERFRSGSRSDALDVAGGQAIYSPVTGSAALAGAAYAVARPRTLLGPFGVFEAIKSDDRLPATLWAALAGTVLTAMLIGMLALWLERDRPLARMIAGMAATRDGLDRGERLPIAEFSGRNRTLAAAINDTLDHAMTRSGGAAPKRAARLDDILGETPEAAAEPPSQFFGFSGAQKQALTGSSAGAAVAPVLAAHAAVNASDPPTVSIAKQPAPAPAPPTFKAAAPPKGVKPLPPTPPKAAPPAAAQDDDDPATAVAQIPDELLGESGRKQKNAAASEDDHFREVFDRYVVTKRECGESTDGLTFERFAITLRKNKEGIVAKSGVSNVHFSVYVKDGKAALKATPVK
jgi:hypothetical protein